MNGKSYTYPNLKWYQFIQKRRWEKALDHLSPGERIKLRTASTPKLTFTGDFEVSAWVKIDRRD